MKNVEIQKMTVNEFKEELTQENFDYIQEKYPSILRALEVYQEGAESSEQEVYLNVNEYFEAIKNMELN